MLEDKQVSQPYRREYRDSVHGLIRDMQEKARQERTRWMSPEQARDQQPFYREQLKQLLGWPLTQPYPDEAPKMIVREEVSMDQRRMLRVQFEVFPGFLYYGLLYLPQVPDGALPLIICQHGGHGTPELCSDLHGENNYTHVVQQLLKRDAVVFCPQMLLWREQETDEPHFPGYGLPYKRNETDAALRQLGGSLAALEVYCLMRAVDALVQTPEVDGERIGMLGLSYGGFYTQLMTAVDLRIRAAHSSAFFNRREQYCWPDFAWQGAALRMQDAEICALIAPRPLTLEVGAGDLVFDYRYAVEEFKRLEPYYQAHNAENRLRLAVVETNHQYFEVDSIIDRLLTEVEAR